MDEGLSDITCLFVLYFFHVVPKGDFFGVLLMLFGTVSTFPM